MTTGASQRLRLGFSTGSGGPQACRYTTHIFLGPEASDEHSSASIKYTKAGYFYEHIIQCVSQNTGPFVRVKKPLTPHFQELSFRKSQTVTEPLFQLWFQPPRCMLHETLPVLVKDRGTATAWCVCCGWRWWRWDVIVG